MWLNKVAIKQIRIITLCKIIVTFMRRRHYYKGLPYYWNIKYITYTYEMERNSKTEQDLTGQSRYTRLKALFHPPILRSF